MTSNSRKDFVQAMSNVAVREANDRETLRPEPFVAARVVIGAQIVHPAIDLDDQSSGQAGEIDDIDAERNLAAKSQASLLFVAQVPP